MRLDKLRMRLDKLRMRLDKLRMRLGMLRVRLDKLKHVLRRRIGRHDSGALLAKGSALDIPAGYGSRGSQKSEARMAAGD